jgi:hypothetical protein
MDGKGKPEIPDVRHVPLSSLQVDQRVIRRIAPEQGEDYVLVAAFNASL